MKAWTREELAWVAGLLEGEGSFVLRAKSRTKLLYPTVQVGMTDEDIIRRLPVVLGMGTVCLSTRVRPRKDAWVFSVQNQQHAYALMVAVWPWLGQRRREQVRHVCGTWIRQPVSPRGHNLTKAARAARASA